MKVGLFIDTWYPMVDGVIKVVDNYARRLQQYCEVVVFCPETRGYSEEEDAKLPYKVTRCHSLPLIGNDYDIPTPVLDPAFEAQLITSGIDMVHIHSPFTLGLSGLAYAKLRKLPVVATLHSQYKQDFEKPLKLKPALNMAMNGIMRVFNACDECWAVNAGIQELYQKEYGLTAPCKVRLNATDHKPVADPEAAARWVNEKYNIPVDATVFLFVGRINFIKNLDFTVRALALAKQKGLQNFRMLFVGQGQDEEKLAKLVKEQGLANEVVMCGLVSGREELEKLYSRAKLFLFPSLYDANSLVQIEAACQGTPTVFLEGARTAATVKADVNGYVSAPGEENYADLILDILGHPEAYEKVAAAARRDLYLNWDDVVRDVYADYCTFAGKIKPISTEKAPAAIGPYSQAIDSGTGLIFVSGQLPIDPATGAFPEGGVKEQTRQSLTNAAAILAAAGLSLKNVVKTTVFLADMADFAAMNEVYAQFFLAPFPARSAVAVKTLPKGALVEIECIASCSK
ncbi:MAG: glycosyltransferase [Bacteroidales bacterium]|nr:glycosyltransferase [Bacteroidales bacterium]